MAKYTALIIDLKKSRAYEKDRRNRIQQYISVVTDALNLIFASSLAKNVSFSAGDELQGLFKSVEASYLYFRWFSMLVAPIEIRAGIGIGDWDVVLENAPTTAQDGSAYHYARFAIDVTEDSLGYSVLMFSGGNDDIVANSLLNSTALIIHKQSEYQNEVMLLSEILYPITVNGILDIDKMEIIRKLLALKKHFICFDWLKRNKAKREPWFLKLDQIEPIDFCIRPIDALSASDFFFIKSGKVRGLPLQLAKIIGVTRQSMDKTIKSANIYEARNLAVATLRYLAGMGG